MIPLSGSTPSNNGRSEIGRYLLNTSGLNRYPLFTDRRASDAVAKISEAGQDGYKWGVDCDLKSYFDMVNHDLLMRQISEGKRQARSALEAANRKAQAVSC